MIPFDTKFSAKNFSAINWEPQQKSAGMNFSNFMRNYIEVITPKILSKKILTRSKLIKIMINRCKDTSNFLLKYVFRILTCSLHQIL